MLAHEEILRGLASLPPDGLREAQARIAALQGQLKPSPVSDNWTALVYDEMCSLIARRTGQKCPPLSVFRRSKFGRPLSEGADTIIAYAHDHLHPQTKTETHRAIRLLVGMIVRQVVAEGRVRLAPGSVASQLKRVGEIVDANFPGYVASGLLSRVLRPRKIA